MKNGTNPMQRRNCQPVSLSACPKCYAKTRSGSPCRSPSVKGKLRCRMHGGAAGSGAPCRETERRLSDRRLHAGGNCGAEDDRSSCPRAPGAHEVSQNRKNRSGAAWRYVDSAQCCLRVRTHFLMFAGTGLVWVVRRKSTLVRKAEPDFGTTNVGFGPVPEVCGQRRLRYEIRLIHKADIGASDPEDSCRALRSIAV